MRVLDTLFIFDLKSFAIADFLDQFWDRRANSTIFRVDILDANLYLCNKCCDKISHRERNSGHYSNVSDEIDET